MSREIIAGQYKEIAQMKRWQAAPVSPAILAGTLLSSGHERDPSDKI
ncbi:MAG: hypothetical protein POG74_06080 [Acidocella sp.]|nr:hypothetical protein [Acidocella sp.]